MDPLVWVVGWLIALVAVAVSLKVVGKRLDEKTMPLMAVLAAGIFVAQMLNFPIGGGTSGHLIGAALATVLLGPWAAMLIITVILIIQALVFGDGGVTALGLNILNMAVVAPLVTWGVMVTLNRWNRLSVPVAAWASVFFASMAVAFELAVSYSISGGVYGIPNLVAFPTIAAYHVIIGIGEAVITSGVILYVSRTAPEMLKLKRSLKNKEPTPEA